MEKITLIKEVKYYDKGRYINSEITEKRYFTSKEDVKAYMKNYELHYVVNKKGLSAYEELKASYWKTYNNLCIFYKSIEPDTLKVAEKYN